MATHPPVHVLDDYYLAITFLITVAYQLIGFSVAFTYKFDKLTDFMGGSNFVWLAIITLSLSGTTNARQIVTSIFIMLWAARLSGFLLFRILKTGKDDRFDDKRDKFFSFLGFWIFQMLWVWTVSLPVTILNSPKVLQYRQPSFGKATDIIAIIFYVVALTIEAVSDVQKYRFKQSEQGKQPGAVCNVGLFKYSRHPNYFGEIMVQVCMSILMLLLCKVHAHIRSSYLHHGNNTRKLPYHPFQLWRLRCAVRQHARLDLPHFLVDVLVRPPTPGASRCQEAV